MDEYTLKNMDFYDDNFWEMIEENYARIVEPKYRWENKKKYWISVVKPNGYMILPSKDEHEIKGHPDLAEKIIYPEDDILELLFDFFIEEKTSIKKAIFMIYYGYSSINEEVDFEDEFGKPIIFYNPFAIKQSILLKLFELGEISSSVSLDSATEENIAFSMKIPFFTRKVTRKLQDNNIESLEDLLNKLGLSIDVFFMIINGEYKNFETRLLKLLELPNLSAITKEKIDLVRMIKHKLNISPEEIFDYIDAIEKKETDKGITPCVK